MFMALVALLLSAVVLVALPETHPAERRIPLRVGALVRSLASVARSWPMRPVRNFLVCARTIAIGI